MQSMRWFWQALMCCSASGVMAAHVAGFHTVLLNGVEQPGFAYLWFDEASQPYMALKDFMALGFSVTVPARVRDGLEVVPLWGQDGLLPMVDAQQLRLSLDVEPQWYAATRTHLNALSAGQALPALPGAWLNYSLQAGRTGDAPLALASTQSWSVFGPAGLFQLNTSMTSVNDASPGASGPLARKFSRLGTTFWRDDEKRLTTLAIGDGVLPASVGVPSVRYGGLTWQSNFGLDPAFSTLETPAIFDAARLPSTLEFFLNDRRVGAPLAVPAGPFEIRGLPTIDGAGQVKVLIRDALNNERIVSVPYLQTARLYRQGLHSFSYTAGLLRPDLDRYNTPFLTSSHRWGVRPWLTLDAGATLSADSQSVGAGLTFPLQEHVVADARLATSKSQAGLGQQVGASVQWWVSVASIGASVSHSSASFRLVGDSMSALARPRDELRLLASRALGHGLGSVSASYGRLSTWGDGTRAISSLSWTRSFRGFNFSVSGVRSNDVRSLQIGVSLPLSQQGFLSSSLQRSDAATSWRSDYASAPLTGKGFAVRASMTAGQMPGQGDSTSTMLAGDARSDIGEHGVQLERHSGQSAWRARTAGSVGVLAGHAFWGPPISHGFALVSTGDAPSIPVYRWNLPVAVSDARGLALVTRLSPYQNNLLAIRPEEVPMEYRVTQHEVTAVPHSRGGVFVAFAMLRERPALLTLHLPDGRHVPSGALVTLLASGERAPVGQGGQVYLQNVPEHAEVEVGFQQQRCRVVLSRPLTNDPQPRLGPFTCAWQVVP